MANIKPRPPTITVEVSHRATIRWSGASDDKGIAKYELWDGDKFLRTLRSTTRVCSVSPIDPGPHDFRIVAYDEEGESANSNIVSIDIHSDSVPAPTPPPPQPPAPPASEFKFNRLVFEDNFDTLDLAKWSLYNGAGHAGNGLRDPKAWSIQDGVSGATGKCLVCTAWWDPLIQKIRTGGMSIRGQSHLYGRFAARVRFEPDPLHVTNALFMTWPSDQQWPLHGENNIWESNSGDRAPMMTFIHYDHDNKQKYFAHPGSDGTKWNEVQMEWTPDYIKIWVNGVLSWTMTDKVAIPDWPHHITLQQDAMRNADPGRAIHAYYDWVRIYQQ